jgi:CBS domain-containing protein
MITLKNFTVKETYRLSDEEPIRLMLEDELNQVIVNFANHAELRGIFVVDQEQHFLGVITRTDLLDWARAKLGQFLLKPLTDLDKSIRVITLIKATTVRDILRPETIKAAIHEVDTLDQALRIMVEMDLILLPVINESKQLIGSLSLSELLNRTLE